MITRLIWITKTSLSTLWEMPLNLIIHSLQTQVYLQYRSALSVLNIPGPWFNIKMLSYQYRNSHWGDKMILWPSYIHNGISYTGKMTSLYWFSSLVAILSHCWCSNCPLCITAQMYYLWMLANNICYGVATESEYQVLFHHKCHRVTSPVNGQLMINSVSIKWCLTNYIYLTAARVLPQPQMKLGKCLWSIFYKERLYQQLSK